MNDSGMSLPSVIVSLVLFSFCLTAALNGYTKATGAAWTARVRQQAGAVAAWHTADAQRAGCGADVTGLRNLGGQELLPHDGFDVTCDDTSGINWPPPLIGITVACDPSTDLDCVAVLEVTVEWATLRNVPRSLTYVVIQEP